MKPPYDYTSWPGLSLEAVNAVARIVDGEDRPLTRLTKSTLKSHVWWWRHLEALENHSRVITPERPTGVPDEIWEMVCMLHAMSGAKNFEEQLFEAYSRELNARHHDGGLSCWPGLLGFKSSQGVIEISELKKLRLLDSMTRDEVLAEIDKKLGHRFKWDARRPKYPSGNIPRGFSVRSGHFKSIEKIDRVLILKETAFDGTDDHHKAISSIKRAIEFGILTVN